MKGSKDSKGFDFQEMLETLNTLDPENIGAWPLPVKAFIYVAVFVGVLALGWAFDLSGISAARDTGEYEQKAILDEFESKVFKAQNLETYKQQLKEMEDSFGALLRQLPKDTEVPGLLEDISQAGLGSGLEFDAIELGQEASKEFYAEQPISIKVRGDYHAFGAFVSGIAGLPRIVTLHDFKIEPVTSAKQRDPDAPPVLSMAIKANTYRYSEAVSKPKEEAQAKKGKGKAGKAAAGGKK
ncbi:MAG: type 4a pilus biogenesis protein PilO [Moraxellaceae bacterium]|nr:type 4a pilus biogenesis protein PilO [Moraxellaceae bacterium]